MHIILIYFINKTLTIFINTLNIQITPSFLSRGNLCLSKGLNFRHTYEMSRHALGGAVIVIAFAALYRSRLEFYAVYPPSLEVLLESNFIILVGKKSVLGKILGQNT